MDGKVVFYCYPIKGCLGVPLPEGWDENSLCRRIYLSNLFIWWYLTWVKLIGQNFFGLGDQNIDYQKAMVERPLRNDVT